MKNEDEIRELTSAIKQTEEQLRYYRERLRELVGPFETGQTVRVPGNGRMNEAQVVAVDRAFGDWVVKVCFDEGGRYYIYPASVVEEIK